MGSGFILALKGSFTLQQGDKKRERRNPSSKASAAAATGSYRVTSSRGGRDSISQPIMRSVDCRYKSLLASITLTLATWQFVCFPCKGSRDQRKASPVVILVISTTVMSKVA